MGGFDLDMLRQMKAMVDDIEPAPFLAASAAFPTDRALKFTMARRSYFGAHPDFWAKVPKAGDADGFAFQLGAVEVWNLDADPAKRAEFMAALSSVTALAEARRKERGGLLNIKP